jgi:hypothetical protein
MVVPYHVLGRGYFVFINSWHVSTSTPSIPKYLSPLTFTPTLTIRLIQKIKVMKTTNII